MTKSKNNGPLICNVTVAYKDDKDLSGLLQSIEQFENQNFSSEGLVPFIIFINC